MLRDDKEVAEDVKIEEVRRRMEKKMGHKFANPVPIWVMIMLAVYAVWRVLSR